MSKPLSLGPVMVSLDGPVLDDIEREMIAHPLTGGVILFSRNFESLSQLETLIGSIRASSPTPLLIAVDHEGGRVQRFKSGFTRLPAMGSLLAHSSLQEAMTQAYRCGYVMAAELLAAGIDLSFAPVLDLDRGCPAIGDRSFSADPQEVITLSQAFCEGMHKAGMATTGKHFPGHGSVTCDSHHVSPVDGRDWQTLQQHDLVPFQQLIAEGKLDAMMPAHVIFSAMDPEPVGFSSFWLQQVLRQQLEFEGVVFSDDLSMAGAAIAGDYLARAKRALDAGCDMILACNDRAGALQIIKGLDTHCGSARISDLCRASAWDWKRLHNDPLWCDYAPIVAALGATDTP